MNVADLLAGSSIPLVSALMLGLLCALSPCTMATNAAALAYVSRGAAVGRRALFTAVLYTLGRMASYTLIGFLIILAGLEMAWLSRILQGAGATVLGPFLIVVGVILLFVDYLPSAGSGGRLTALGAKLANRGPFGGFLLGALFALAFCPYSGVLYFAVLIPLALKTVGGIALPAVFAVGTGVPVLVFGALLSLGVSRTTAVMDALTRADRVVRLVVAGVFIAAGIYCMVGI